MLYPHLQMMPASRSPRMATWLVPWHGSGEVLPKNLGSTSLTTTPEHSAALLGKRLPVGSEIRRWVGSQPLYPRAVGIHFVDFVVFVGKSDLLAAGRPRDSIRATTQRPTSTQVCRGPGIINLCRQDDQSCSWRGTYLVSHYEYEVGRHRSFPPSPVVGPLHRRRRERRLIRPYRDLQGR